MKIALMIGQKAPSAKRCIKTGRTPAPESASAGSQKAPSAKRCIKTRLNVDVERGHFWPSESTERQTVH